MRLHFLGLPRPPLSKQLYGAPYSNSSDKQKHRSAMQLPLALCKAVSVHLLPQAYPQDREAITGIHQVRSLGPNSFTALSFFVSIRTGLLS